MKRVPYKIGEGVRNFARPAVEVKATDGEVGQLYVEEIASMVVAELKKKAEDHLGRTVRDAIVTVPGHFNDPSTWAAMDASKMAGLDVMRTVSEQSAAAVAYGLHVDGKLRENGNVLVLHGIVGYFVKLIKTKHGKDISDDRNRIALGKLRTAFIALVEKAMVQAELEMGKIKIDEVALVGGSTMIPKIQRLVRDYFGGKELSIVVKPDEAVAHGAAVHVHSTPDSDPRGTSAVRSSTPSSPCRSISAVRPGRQPSTADVSVVTLMGGSLGVLAYWDGPLLGGDDFDQRIVEHFAELVKVKHGKDVREDRIALAKLRTACERAKKALSSQDRVQVTVESLFDGVDFSEPLSRSKFEELNDDTFGRVVALIRSTSRRDEDNHATITTEEGSHATSKISEIILVGGRTMIPKLQTLVKDYFNGTEPNMRLKQDEAVALGALFHAYSSV
nr:unnamed protein product [Digitaria exilis]